MTKNKIKYKVVTSKNTSWLGIKMDYIDIQKTLNDLGQEGWDLVDSVEVRYANGSTKELVFFFKKEED